MRSSLAAFASAAALLTSIASAQLPSFSIDIGSASSIYGTPTAGYAAAGPIGGTWDVMDSDQFPATGPYTTPPLLDTNDNLTSVTLTLDALGFPLIDFDFDEPFTAGDDQALMDDLAYTNGPSELRWNGLPAGTYDVIVYAMAPDDATGRTTINVVNSSSPFQEIGGDFSGGFVQGVTHSFHTVDVLAGVPLIIEVDFTVFADSINGIQIFPSGTAGLIGTNYCGPAVPNTTGAPAFLTATGSRDPMANDVTLSCNGLPQFSFGFFIVSQTQGFVMNPGGSSGNICLAGSVGRYVGPGQVQNSGAAGEIVLPLELTMIPQPNGFVPVMNGETWNFQTWYRDSTPGGAPTSNFSDGLQIDFL